MSRPQIGIERLPARRTNEHAKESMNCSSCRKRKIKCNRLRPTCEACQIFACACVYDAIPKKRGPKTDVLEALLRRVDGLERRLKHGDEPLEADHSGSSLKDAILETVRSSSSPDGAQSHSEPNRAESATTSSPDTHLEIRSLKSIHSALQADEVPHIPSSEHATLMMNTYFSRIHQRPYDVLDEVSTRQSFESNQLPSYLSYAIFAVSARYTASYGSFPQLSSSARDFAQHARAELDIDDPSIDGLQTLLLLSQAMFQEGSGKKTYMYLSLAIAMALALNLHRELPVNSPISSSHREHRRRLFWSCYLMDRFAACGSNRPSSIAEECILLRLPSDSLENLNTGYEAEFFPNNSNLQLLSGFGGITSGGARMLIGITRILSMTNRYLAAGGVKGDSHFPWHAASTLSRIRQDLDIWASDTQDAFTSIEALFGRSDSVLSVMSKLIYHLIYCLIYRPFLPVDLVELETTSQHQSWQIEATNMCFLHANAITELVEIGRTSAIVDFPAFVSYCICTAGTIHVHGAFYQGQIGDVYSMSGDFLTREVQQLTELRSIWGGIQHQKDTLQALYGAHAELVSSLASNPIRFSPVFQMEDFFDRYPGHSFDGAHITLGDPVSEHQGSTRQNSQAEGEPRPPAALHRAYSDQTTFSQPTRVQSTLSTRPSNANRKRRSTGLILTRQVSDGAELARHQSASTVAAGHQYLVSPIDQQHQYISEASHHTAISLGAPYANNTGIEFMQLDYSAQQPADSSSHNNNQYDPMLSMQYNQINEMETPRPMMSNISSNSGGMFYQNPSMSRNSSGQQQEEVDPFLALLEQIAENEQSRAGPSELDYYLSGS